jgi:transcriptional regulator with XRE-family HTH domain
VRKRKLSPVDVEVGRRIRLQRLSAGMSQTELGNRLGITFQQVQKYEKGVNRVGAGRLTQIAAILNVPVTVFFDGATEPTVGKHESPTELLTRPHALKVLRAYSAIDNDKIRLSILHLIKAIADERLH